MLKRELSPEQALRLMARWLPFSAIDRLKPLTPCPHWRASGAQSAVEQVGFGRACLTFLAGAVHAARGEPTCGWRGSLRYKGARTSSTRARIAEGATSVRQPAQAGGQDEGSLSRATPPCRARCWRDYRRALALGRQETAQQSAFSQLTKQLPKPRALVRFRPGALTARPLGSKVGAAVQGLAGRS